MLRNMKKLKVFQLITSINVYFIHIKFIPIFPYIKHIFICGLVSHLSTFIINAKRISNACARVMNISVIVWKFMYCLIKSLLVK